ncbi:MAG: hypothetical protein H0T18_05335 [Chloroflexia bacterium]|nr:hypothetical protein [Chloroflexia bacterium]
MIARTLVALRRRLAGQPPPRQLRPTELRRDVVRAERLRREATAVSSVTAQPLTLEEQRPRRVRVEPPQPPSAEREPWQKSALRSRSSLRQALLLKEILDPPLALRDRGERACD